MPARGPSKGDNSWKHLKDFFENELEARDNISNELANMANTFFRTKPTEEKAKSLAQKHLWPQNVNNLQVPKVEEHLWRQLKLKKETKAFDFAMQRSQFSLCQVMVPVLKIMDTIKSDTVPNKVKEISGDTFNILAHAIV